MKKHTISDERVKSILLNHRYPEGNITRLLEHTTLAHNVASLSISLCTHLTEDDWAFTSQRPPLLRYRVGKTSSEVYDAITDKAVGVFFTRLDALEYAQFLNDQLPVEAAKVQ